MHVIRGRYYSLARVEMDIPGVVRGHYVYKRMWTPVIGEELTVLPEENNIHDRYAVAVMKDNEIVADMQR